MIHPKAQEYQKSLTPDKAIEMLKHGNKRFIEKSSSGREYHTELSNENPFPWAIVHRCMDSRVLPEIIFDAGIGDIFVTGIAGNIINDDIAGSMELACEVTGAKLVLILGHTKCAAIQSAMGNLEMGKITGLLDKISPSIQSSKDKDDIKQITELNVRNSIKHLRNSSKILSDLEKAGEIKIAGAIYDVATGKVTFLN